MQNTPSLNTSAKTATDRDVLLWAKQGLELAAQLLQQLATDPDMPSDQALICAMGGVPLLIGVSKLDAYLAGEACTINLEGMQ